MKVSKEKAESVNNAAPSEDQWVIEFFIALKSLIGNEHTIHSQCFKHIDNEFIGEMDLYINGKLCQPYELTREVNQVEFHVLRKYMSQYPDFLENIKEKITGRYFFPKVEKCMVIDFRKGEFNRIDQYIVKNKEGKELDLGPLIKQDLMRVCYGDFTKIQIYYKEDHIKTIEPVP